MKGHQPSFVWRVWQLSLAAIGCRGPECPEEIGASEPSGHSNVLIILLDDVGAGQLGAFGVGRSVAPTPTIDCLCRRGVRFSRFWAHALCSPSRAQLYTGRLSLNAGVGRNIKREEELPSEQITVAEVLSLAGYRTGLVGKWHLGGIHSPGGLLGPNNQGFQRFAGSLANLSVGDRGDPEAGSYDHWLKVTDGSSEWTERYATEDVVDEALAFISEGGEPWLLVAAFQAPHKPHHEPPHRLISSDPPKDAPDEVLYRAALEAADHEIGRLLAGIAPEVLANTDVLLLGDNGPPSQVIEAPLDPDQDKGTLTEGGLRVPLVIAGPHAPDAGEILDALVHEVDLMPTVVEIAGAALPDVPLDGVSLLPLLEGEVRSVRETLIAALPPARFGRTREVARDERYKLMRKPDGSIELLMPDDARLVDGPDLLLDGTSAEEADAIERLSAALDASL